MLQVTEIAFARYAVTNMARVNGMLGLATPKIVTPVQLLESDEDN